MDTSKTYIEAQDTHIDIEKHTDSLRGKIQTFVYIDKQRDTQTHPEHTHTLEDLQTQTKQTHVDKHMQTHITTQKQTQTKA